METNFLCATTGEPCWNVRVLQQYARSITKQEAAFADSHQDIDLQSGEIGCEGVVENEYGLGKVCLPYVDPPLIVYQDAVLDLASNVRYLREIKGFKLVKPDGSQWDKLFNRPKY